LNWGKQAKALGSKRTAWPTNNLLSNATSNSFDESIAGILRFGDWMIQYHYARTRRHHPPRSDNRRFTVVDGDYRSKSEC
jgi:hypothetical protein